MQIREIMSTRPELVKADATIRDAARCMRDHDHGLAPVYRDDKLVGLITDRDIAVRGLADGKNADDPVDSIMSNEVLYCFEEDDIKQVLKNMQDQHIQRLIVLDNEESKQLVGIISLSDIANNCTDADSALAVARCCRSYH